MVGNGRILGVLALMAGACGSEIPAAPQVELGPVSPTTLDELVATITATPDADPADLRVVWTVDGIEMGDLQGSEVIAASRTSKNTEWTVRAFYVDGGGTEGESSSASVTVVNSLPVASATATPSEPESDEDVQLSVSVDDADGDATSFAVQWLRNGSQSGLTGDLLPGSVTERGDVWSALVTPNDGEADGEAVEVSVNIANKPPVVDRISLTPDDPTEASTLTGAAEGSDPDGDTVTWTWAWSVNDSVVAGQDGLTLSGTHFDRGDVVRFIATPGDGFIQGEAATSEPVTILNTPPTLVSATITPTDAYASTELTCTGEGYADRDGDPETLLYTWTIDGSPAGNSRVLAAGAATRGNSVICSITPFDGEVEGIAVDSAPLVIRNSPPTLSAASISPSSPSTTDTLSATLGTSADPDGDSIRHNYAWTVNGSAAGSGPTLAPSRFKKGDAIAVTVTPNDGTEDGAAVVSASVTAVNTAPVIGAVGLSPSSPRTDAVVSASVTSSDADGDRVTYTYAWTVDGASIGATGATLDGSTWFDKGDTIAVSVTPSDGAASGAAVSSSTITAANSPPTLASASLTPSSPREGDTLTCGGTGFADADGDSETLRYAWAINGTVLGGATSSTLTGASFKKGDKVDCRVTPFDGTVTGVARTSPSRTILNTAPVLTSVSLSPSSPKFGDTLTATASGVSDADGDSVTLELGWYQGTKLLGTTTTTTTSSTYTAPGGLRKGEDMTVRVRPFDGSARGTEVRSPKVTVANTAPVIGSVSVLSPLYTDGSARSARSYSDVDPADSSLTETYAWTVNTKSVSGTSSTLASSNFKKGDSVAFTLTVSDGTDSDSKAASAVVVRNTAPTAPKVALTPLLPVDSADLVCGLTAGSSDADGDSITYEFEWTLNGKAWTGSTGTSKYAGDLIDADDTLPREKWSCTAYATDGTDDSADAVSGTVTIRAESPPKVGSRSSFGVSAGDHWEVCSATSKVAWMSADTSGTYNPTSICIAYGYDRVSAFGNTTSVCSVARFDGKGGTATKLVGSVHWTCAISSSGGGGSIP